MSKKLRGPPTIESDLGGRKKSNWNAGHVPTLVWPSLPYGGRKDGAEKNPTTRGGGGSVPETGERGAGFKSLGNERCSEPCVWRKMIRKEKGAV